jgi:hypothetical protein
VAPHPIFDRSTFAWERPEAKALFELLVKSVTQKTEIGQLYAEAGGEAASLDTSQAPRDLWRDALNLLASVRALRSLCEEVLPGVARLQGVTAFQAALQAVVEAIPNAQRRIISGKPVLDRQPLRAFVTTLQSEESLRVLLVRGDPKTGKTYGRYVFHAAAADSGATAVYLYAPMVATVDDVVAELFSALHADDEIPPKDTTDPAWYAAVCRKLGRVAAEKKAQLWIAVDDLGAASEDDGAPLLDREVTKFCQQFVYHIANPSFGQWFRLMLIDYPTEPVPTRWIRDVWAEDTPTSADVKAQDVQDYLRDWASSQDRTFVEEELEALANDVIGSVDGPPAAEATLGPRLQRLNDKLAETLQKQTTPAP